MAFRLEIGRFAPPRGGARVPLRGSGQRHGNSRFGRRLMIVRVVSASSAGRPQDRCAAGPLASRPMIRPRPADSGQPFRAIGRSSRRWRAASAASSACGLQPGRADTSSPHGSREKECVSPPAFVAAVAIQDASDASAEALWLDDPGGISHPCTRLRALGASRPVVVRIHSSAFRGRNHNDSAAKGHLLMSDRSSPIRAGVDSEGCHPQGATAADCGRSRFDGKADA